MLCTVVDWTAAVSAVTSAAAGVARSTQRVDRAARWSQARAGGGIRREPEAGQSTNLLSLPPPPHSCRAAGCSPNTAACFCGGSSDPRRQSTIGGCDAPVCVARWAQAVTFLQSAHSPEMCVAELKINGIGILLDGGGGGGGSSGSGSDMDGSSGKNMSVAHTEWLEADSRHRHKGFAAKPHTRYTATLTVAHPPSHLRKGTAKRNAGGATGSGHSRSSHQLVCKFKLISFISC